ncbi:uncharacterized protein BDW43DRAFT_316724 [Aspergillus alliaceus]|uniref:uncharacterized protein n=1 Tax=Petromyces alliaceus TaxID=209559 RepID=UPI0012A63FCD|nr:uncharacterized protein BDW43DRAFT_316724 [Aspergillus alliaceus]KAB8227549.1 hypothetical protein BDW43DRAFT_316724 [Aspergillus alliaceus]
MPITGFLGFLQVDNAKELEEMENKGYYIIASKPVPDESSVQSVEESIRRNSLHGSPSGSDTANCLDWRTYGGVKTKESWEKFMNIGFNLDINLVARFGKAHIHKTRGKFSMSSNKVHINTIVRFAGGKG